VSQYTGALLPKRLDMLRELLPQAATIGFLTNPTALSSEQNWGTPAHLIKPLTVLKLGR
jgi:hypothetical protein